MPRRVSSAREYLEPASSPRRVDTLVLGCTHYPLLKPLLRDVLGSQVSPHRQRRRRQPLKRPARSRARIWPPTMRRIRVTGSSRPTIRYSFFSWANAFLGGTIEGVEIRTSAEPIPIGAQRDPILGDMKKCWRIEPRARIGAAPRRPAIVRASRRASVRRRSSRVQHPPTPACRRRDQAGDRHRAPHSCDLACELLCRPTVSRDPGAATGTTGSPTDFLSRRRTRRYRLSSSGRSPSRVPMSRATGRSRRATARTDSRRRRRRAEHVAAPTVVVAGDPSRLAYAGVDDVGKGGERSESAARNDRHAIRTRTRTDHH